LVEGPSKKSPEFLQGRNPQNKVIVFPRENFEKGQYVNVLVNGCTSATLRGVAV
jgi:tRNA-2-methylthio-N6-dimethylallyladenosine synthase